MLPDNSQWTGIPLEAWEWTTLIRVNICRLQNPFGYTYRKWNYSEKGYDIKEGIFHAGMIFPIHKHDGH